MSPLCFVFFSHRGKGRVWNYTVRYLLISQLFLIAAVQPQSIFLFRLFRIEDIYLYYSKTKKKAHQLFLEHPNRNNHNYYHNCHIIYIFCIGLYCVAYWSLSLIPCLCYVLIKICNCKIRYKFAVVCKFHTFPFKNIVIVASLTKHCQKYLNKL